jgi:hypothetical protein
MYLERGNHATKHTRSSSTSAIGSFLSTKKKEGSKDIIKINKKVFDFMGELSNDYLFSVKLGVIGNLIKVFSGTNITGLDKNDIDKAIKMLYNVSQNDVHVEVREGARRAEELIKKSQTYPSKVEKIKAYHKHKLTQRHMFYRQWNKQK